MVEGKALCLDTFGCEPETVEPWEPLRHTFSHYHLDIAPFHIRITRANDRVGETSGHLWYDPQRPEAVGMAAPVARLLARLDST